MKSIPHKVLMISKQPGSEKSPHKNFLIFCHSIFVKQLIIYMTVLQSSLKLSHQKNNMERTLSAKKKYSFIGIYRYEEKNLLGSGFESKVYRAQHILKKHEVALKIINVENLSEGINQKLFQAELRCLHQLKSTPHVLNLHEVIRKEEKIYVVTELCLADLTSRPDKKLPKEKAWAYLQQVIKGYRYLHEKGIVHRDLKPGNLFFNMNKEIKIGDFGFAAKLSQVRKQNYYNIGTPGYMAPQSVHRNEYSHATDIWSIGIIYYQLLTGSLPCTASSEGNIQKQINQEYLKQALNKPEIDAHSKQFLEKVLCFNQFDRMKPEDLFEYKLDQSSQEASRQSQKSLIENKKGSFYFLSKTTAEKNSSQKQVNHQQITTIKKLLEESPQKGREDRLKTGLKAQMENTSAQNLQKNEQNKNYRRNSFNIHEKSPGKETNYLEIQSPRYSNYPLKGAKNSEFKKKRKSYDVSQKVSAKKNINHY